MSSVNQLQLGLIGTITENDDVPVEEESSDSENEESKSSVQKLTAKKKNKKVNNTEFNTGFDFSDESGLQNAFDAQYAMKIAKKKREVTSLDDKIAKARKKRKKERKQEEITSTENVVVSDSEEEMEEEEEESSSGEEMEIDTVKTKERQKRKRKKKKYEEENEENEKMEFTECIDTYDDRLTFQDMNCSRPLMKALSAMNFEKPTPIQAATIPVALLGRDLCACAVTGSGKTVAFMLPILERLLYKPKHDPVTRVLVVLPTRELAVQVHTVARQLSQFTSIHIALSTGGLDLKAQEAALRLGPDVVIATPGRLIDHIHNSPSFSLSSIEILVLDEADRMLDEYFAEQMKEVIRLCSRTRQTMLFSATMTEEVKDLAAVSLKNPVKIFMNESTDVAFGLRQEFIRIRANREGDREAVVSALVSRTFRDHCIVFIQTKKQAHRMHIVLGLLGVNVGELHGDLSQAQRLEALQKFKNAEIDVLLATDLAARGLDIQGVKTVINFTMPNTIKHYVHRVGRTARAGRKGRSVTLVGEQERKMLKDIVKKAKTPLKTRIIPQEVIAKYRHKIAKFEVDVKAIEGQEKEEKIMRATENQMNKAQRLLERDKGEEGQKRGWFQTHRERVQEKEKLRLGEYSGPNQKTKSRDRERPKAKDKSAEDRVQHELSKSQLYAIRSSTKGVKNSFKPKRLRACAERENKGESKKKKKMTEKKNARGQKKSAFDKELTSTGSSDVRQYRAGPSYKERKQLGLPSKKGQSNKTKKRGKR